jgi:hypothetical protein
MDKRRKLREAAAGIGFENPLFLLLLQGADPLWYPVDLLF